MSMLPSPPRPLPPAAAEPRTTTMGSARELAVEHEHKGEAVAAEVIEDNSAGASLSSSTHSNTGAGILPEDKSRVGEEDDPADYLRMELYERMQKEDELFTWLQRAALDGIWYWDLSQPEYEWLSPEFKQL